MTTKQWLMRAMNIDREIDSLLKARGELYDRVTKITQSYTGDVVQSTKDPHRFEKLAEYEIEIDLQIDHLIDVKREINAAINELHDWRLRTVMRERYLGSKTWEQIAVDMHFSYQHVCRLHGRALIELGGILKDVLSVQPST